MLNNQRIYFGIQKIFSFSFQFVSNFEPLKTVKIILSVARFETNWKLKMLKNCEFENAQNFIILIFFLIWYLSTYMKN